MISKNFTLLYPVLSYNVKGSQYAPKIKKCMEFNNYYYSHSFIAWRIIVDCVADKSKPEFKKKLCCKSHFSISKFQTFVGEPAPKSPPPRSRGITVPYLYSQLLYSNLLQFSSYFEPILRQLFSRNTGAFKTACAC